MAPRAGQRLAPLALAALGYELAAGFSLEAAEGCGDSSLTSGLALEAPGQVLASSDAKCGECFKGSCHWCPLTMSCLDKAELCPERQHPFFKPYDQALTDATECSGGQSTWVDDAFDRAFNVSNWAANAAAYTDASRCAQWLLKWPVTPDDKLLEQIPEAERDEASEEHYREASPEQAGVAGCKSALLRAALLRTIEPEVPTSPLCSLIKEPGGTECRVTSKYTHEFAAIRRLSGADAHLKQATAAPMVWSRGVVDPSKLGFAWLAADGAGASSALRVKAQYNLKQEFENLQKLLLQDRLFNHFQNAEHPSILLRPHALFELTFGEDVSKYLLFEDEEYGAVAKAKAVTAHPPTAVAYKLWAPPHVTVLETAKTGASIGKAAEFAAAETNRFLLDDGQCMALREAVDRDTAFLSTAKVIDYALLATATHGEGEWQCHTFTESQNRQWCANGGDEHDAEFEYWYLGGLNTCGASGGACRSGCCKRSKAAVPREASCEGLGLAAPRCMSHGSHSYTFSVVDYLRTSARVEKNVSMITALGDFVFNKFASYDKNFRGLAKRLCPTRKEFFLREEVWRQLANAGDAYASGALDAVFDALAASPGRLAKGDLAKKTLGSVQFDKKPVTFQDVFSALDVVEDGSLDKDEFRELFRELPKEPDTDGAVITFEEVSQIFR